MRAASVRIVGVFLAKEGEECGKVEAERAGYVLAELSLEGIVIADELTDGDAVFLDEVEVGDEPTAFWLGGCTHDAATPLNALFFLNVKDIVAVIFRDFYQSDKSSLKFFLILLTVLLVVDVLLVCLFLSMVGSYLMGL